MTDLHLDTSELAALAATLDAASARAGARAAGIVREHGLLLQTRVKRRASLPRTGPPGPRIITGDYNRSIALRLTGGPATISAEVGTNRPQGRRLEHGFHGADAAGRTYDQRAYPHFGPGLDETEAGFVAAIEALGDLP